MAASRVMEEREDGPYRLRAEFGGEDVVQGGEQQPVELRVQAQEVAEGEDDHLFGVSVHPLIYLCENSLSRTQKAASGTFIPLCGGASCTRVCSILDPLRHLSRKATWR